MASIPGFEGALLGEGIQKADHAFSVPPGRCERPSFLSFNDCNQKNQALPVSSLMKFTISLDDQA